MENLLNLVGLVVLAGFYLLERFWHRKDITKLLNRVMARNYEEYEYYDKKYPRDLKELDNIREQENKIRETNLEELRGEEPFSTDEDIAKKIDEFEEDWKPEELDFQKVKDSIIKE